MGRLIGGAGLLLLALFMLFGFLRSSAALSSPATIVALLVTVGLPAVGGVALLRGRLGGPSRARLDRLRQQTLEAEVLRLAVQHRGRLTAVDVAGAFALTPEDAKATLDGLVTREVADLEVTDEGVLVYTFHEARHLGGKHGSRGLLDA